MFGIHNLITLVMRILPDEEFQQSQTRNNKTMIKIKNKIKPDRK